MPLLKAVKMLLEPEGLVATYAYKNASHITHNSFALSRRPDASVKQIAQEHTTARFVFVRTELVYFFGHERFETLDLASLTCTCVHFKAYAVCSHLTRAIKLFDIQTGVATFVDRKRSTLKKSSTLEELDIDPQTVLQFGTQCLVNEYRRILNLPPCNMSDPSAVGRGCGRGRGQLHSTASASVARPIGRARTARSALEFQ
jgi:hypothetical protein